MGLVRDEIYHALMVQSREKPGSRHNAVMPAATGESCNPHLVRHYLIPSRPRREEEQA